MYYVVTFSPARAIHHGFSGECHITQDFQRAAKLSPSDVAHIQHEDVRMINSVRLNAIAEWWINKGYWVCWCDSPDSYPSVNLTTL